LLLQIHGSWQVSTITSPCLGGGLQCKADYDGDSFLRVDVTPAPKGHYTTLKVQGIAETGDRIDHFTVARRAK